MKVLPTQKEQLAAVTPEPLYRVNNKVFTEKYSRNFAGQTFDIDFLYPWTGPASIRIYFALIYPRRTQEDTDKKGFHSLRSCTARYPDISGIKMAAVFREGGLAESD